MNRRHDDISLPKVLRALLVAALYLAYTLMHADADERPARPAVCATDTECLQHCPPPNDDPDCDGGPE